MNHQMQNIKGQLGDARRRQVKPGLTALCILLVFAMIATGCAKSRNTEPAVSLAARDASLRQIAADYSRTGDLAQAQAALGKLGLANPTQLLVSQAESDVSAGLSASEIEPVARLAEALGARSAKPKRGANGYSDDRAADSHAGAAHHHAYLRAAAAARHR
jgi:hypothetical protein